jgi:hypothetical protein
MLAGAIIVAAPSAAVADGVAPGGNIEVCKTFAAVPAGWLSYQGTFKYVVYKGSTPVTPTSGPEQITINAVTGGPQVCTQPFTLPAGTYTVTEVGNSWSSVANVAASPGDPGTVSWTSGNSASVTVPAVNDNGTNVTTVNYTNDPVYGVVELCKAPAANSSMLTGTYTFNLTSDEPGIRVWDATTGAYDLPWTTTASATISSAGLGCSGPTNVPAGGLNTAEQGTALYVTGIGAVINGKATLPGSSIPVLTDSNLAAGTADVVVQAGTTTNQTIVTYTDAISTVKLCKSWWGPGGNPNTMYPFTASSIGQLAGPTAVTSPSSLQAGTCEILGYVRAGTTVTIIEGVVPGTKVAAITANQGIVPGSLSLPNRTVQVVAGPGETDVTFTDEAADPGQLKICVMPTTGATGGTAAFVVGNAGVATHMIDVNVSSSAEQCTLDPNSFAFNSSVALSGTVTPSPNAFTGTPSVLPTNVEVLEGGILTPTNQMSLMGSTAPSNATVLMSEGTVTEVTFTIDPPAPVTAPTQTSTPTAAQVTANSVDLPSQSGSGGTKTLSPAQVTAALRKQLADVKAEIRALQHKLSKKHLSKAARKADLKRIAALRRLEPRIRKELG